MRILYDSKNTKFKSKLGTLRENEGCTLNIHIPCSCKTKNVILVFNRENGEIYSTYFMIKTNVYNEYEIYSCDICFAKSGLFFYYFIIKTENEEFRLYKQGYDMTNMEEGDLWQLSCIPKNFNVPTDYQGNVMYQIFPDRFFKMGECDTAEKLTPFWIHEDKGDIPCFLPDENGIILNNDFFGGNIKGITSKLDYLKSLNIGVIYLNPIFKAYSNHRYDTADYLKIDELLGNEDDFKTLCDEAHSRDIKIILDGVFSHTGSNSKYFDSEGVFGNGAVSNDDSPYKEWFDFKRYPNEYTSWWGIKTLPCVDENNESYRDYIIRNQDSVIAHWMRLGADGFRLDVADELPDSFILEFRNKMKEIKKDSFLIGEVWEDASNKCSYGIRRKYFTDGELDSVMNYPFRKAIIDFVSGRDDGYSFRNTVMDISENYPECVVNSLMNILSTHDTIRIISALGVKNIPAEKKDRARYRMADEEYTEAKEGLLCAIFLQFILPGTPCIYYGDEIGTEGFEDPFCRSFFDWEKIDNNVILEFYRELSNIKKSCKEIKLGNASVFVERPGTIRIDRTFDGSTFSAYINISDEDYIFGSNKKVIISNKVYSYGSKIITKKFGFILLT